MLALFFVCLIVLTTVSWDKGIYSGPFWSPCYWFEHTGKSSLLSFYLQHSIRPEWWFCRLLLVAFATKLWKNFSLNPTVLRPSNYCYSFASLLKWDSQKYWCHGFYYFPFLQNQTKYICQRPILTVGELFATAVVSQSVPGTLFPSWALWRFPALRRLPVPLKTQLGK